jgi:hypothetical protein
VRQALTSAWVSKFATGLVTAENRRLQDLAEAAARSAQADAAAAGIDCSVETPHLGYSGLLNVFRSQARLHDLSILDAESEVVNLDRGLIEVLLMDSGRPLLVVPPGRDVFQARRIILAWDGSAGANRAVGDALPFLRAAEAVEVISATGEKDLPDAVWAPAWPSI